MSLGYRPISSALLSVYHKDGLEPIARKLAAAGVTLYSTGGTYTFLQGLGLKVEAVDNLTGFPEVFGGRVKTLHPKVFGGILQRRNHETDSQEAKQHDIPAIDLVIVDLYPFEETVKSGKSHEDIIEKIDIGGISLIRAAAKNYQDVAIISHRGQYSQLAAALEVQIGVGIEQRMRWAAEAFHISSHYDTAIFKYFNQSAQLPYFKESIGSGKALRYGENPHQKGYFYGHLDEVLEQLNGKELSYNNLVDIDATLSLLGEFDPTDGPTVVIIKHTNACGVATSVSLHEAYVHALASDPVSAFGGVIGCNEKVDLATAKELHKLFFEVLVAPSYEPAALELLSKKTNRILLKHKPHAFPHTQYKTLLNGVLTMDKDDFSEGAETLSTVTELHPTFEQINAMLFAAKVCKHTKSNAIVLATGTHMLSSGTGQTSRVDALKQAISKAHSFGLSLEGAVMASDAFFPFPDCVEIAAEAGIKAIIQPGGSIKDADSIAAANDHELVMVTTGIRHFRH